MRVIKLPGSKSITNRALLLAACADDFSYLSNVLDSDDTGAMVESLQVLGVQILWDKTQAKIQIKGCAGQWPNRRAMLNAYDAGTVARFLLAACVIAPGSYKMDASARMRVRPIEPLLHVLKSQGVDVSSFILPLVLTSTSKLKGGIIQIDASISSQFVSALLMAAPFAQKEMIIDVIDSVSEPYINMTIRMMKTFGVNVIKNKSYIVPVRSSYIAQDYVIEPDASTASYFFAAFALLQREVLIQDLNRTSSLQGDIEFLSILEKMGCHVAQEASGIKVMGPEKLRGVAVNMRNCSDTFMTLAMLAPFADSPTVISGIAHTRKQESDRVHAIATELRRLQIQVEESEDTLIIHPGTPKAATVQTYGDHRIAMSMAVLQLKVPNLIIANPEVVSKTFPAFFVYWHECFAHPC